MKNDSLFIEHYNEQSFTWLSWRYGCLIDTLQIPHRYETIAANKNLLRSLAIGWCKADNLPCRPKLGYVAVMFNNGDVESWWTHFTIREFKFVFPELEKEI